MRHLLHLNASPRGAASSSFQAGQEAVAHLLRREPSLRIAERQLGVTPLPHIDAAWSAASLMPETARGDHERRILALSEELIGELEAAQMVFISTPMHNYTVPATLKTWIDYVVRPNRTFQSTPDGKLGLLKDRPVRIIVSSGGALEPPSRWQVDFITPYLSHIFNTLGVRDVEVIRLDNMNRGPEAVAASRTRFDRWLAGFRF